MKPLIILLLMRNTLVALVFVLLLSGLRLVPRAYLPPWVLIPIIFFCSLLWANGILIKRGHRIAAIALSLLFIPVLGFPVGIGSSLLGRSLVERVYEAEGLQLVNGCNLAAASGADIDIYMLGDRLAELTNSPNADPNQIIELRKVYALAQEKVRILGDDCRWRGHRDSHPWKTNWVIIRQTLDASKPGWHQ